MEIGSKSRFSFPFILQLIYLFVCLFSSIFTNKWHKKKIHVNIDKIHSKWQNTDITQTRTYMYTHNKYMYIYKKKLNTPGHYTL